MRTYGAYLGIDDPNDLPDPDAYVAPAPLTFTSSLDSQAFFNTVDQTPAPVYVPATPPSAPLVFSTSLTPALFNTQNTVAPIAYSAPAINTIPPVGIASSPPSFFTKNAIPLLIGAAVVIGAVFYIKSVKNKKSSVLST